MLASELIARLATIISEHDDVRVRLVSRHWEDGQEVEDDLEPESIEFRVKDEDLGIYDEISRIVIGKE